MLTSIFNAYPDEIFKAWHNDSSSPGLIQSYITELVNDKLKDDFILNFNNRIRNAFYIGPDDNIMILNQSPIPNILLINSVIWIYLKKEMRFIYFYSPFDFYTNTDKIAVNNQNEKMLFLSGYFLLKSDLSKEQLELSTESTNDDQNIIQLKVEKSSDLLKKVFVFGCTFFNLHPDSYFPEEQMSRFKNYGALFSNEDEKEWERIVNAAYPL